MSVNVGKKKFSNYYLRLTDFKSPKVLYHKKY